MSSYRAEQSSRALTRAVAADAKERGIRSFLWGLMIDCGVAITLFLLTVISDVEWTSTYWTMLGLGVAKSVVQGVVAYFARKLLPPANQ